MDIKKKILEVVQTKTFAHSVVTILSTLVNGVLGASFFIILARNLGPENFGLVSVTIATLTLISDIADFGTNTGLINFIGKHYLDDRDKALRFMKLGLEIKLTVSLLILILGIGFSGIIARNVFLKPELTTPLILAMIGVGGALLFSFVTNTLQAIQKFKEWGILNIFLNGLRVVIILAFVYFSVLDISSTLITYISLPIFGFILGSLMLPLRFIKTSGETKLIKEFFTYNKWVAISIILAAFSSRLDTFITARLLSLREVGIYSVATQLTSIIPQFIYALAIVVAPKLSSFNKDEQAVTYLKKLQLFVIGLCILGLLGIPIAYFLIPVFYGDKFYESIAPFNILFLAQIVFLLSIPAHQAIFYYFSKPKVFTLFSFIQIMIVALMVWLLTERYGIIGSAWGILIGYIVNFVLPSIWVIREFRK